MKTMISIHLGMSPNQTDAIKFIADCWDKFGPTRDLRHLAYMLATTWHETNRTMKPIVEKGKGMGRTYGEIDPVTGFAYYGRGYVQLTWADNYKRMGDLLKLDLYEQSEQALDPLIAATIMFNGMHRGMFTGKRLDYFFHENMNDAFNARRIINHLDKAAEIADYHKMFLGMLNQQGEL